VKGVISAKQLEDEFFRIHSDGWRWTAREVADYMYTVRFPNAPVIQEWACFNPIKMKSVKAKVHVASWNGLVGAKGELQQAWFRVRGVPYDKRSDKTLAYVGSLVGATAEVDKSTLNKADYARVKIAARDVSKIPESAEGAILPYLYEFFYEREVVLEEKKDSVAVSVQDDRRNTEKFSPKKLEVSEPYVQTAVQKEVSKSMVEEGNGMKQQGAALASAPMGETSTAHELCVLPVSSSVKESVEPHNQKHILSVRDVELASLRAGIDRVQGLSGADLEGSEDELMSEKAQESQTKEELGQESHKLGLIMLNSSDIGLNKESSVILHEMEEVGDLSENVVLIEKKVNSDVNL
jgi:hypothetical protein